jgi:hypothetical protein
MRGNARPLNRQVRHLRAAEDTIDTADLGDVSQGKLVTIDTTASYSTAF